MTQPATYLFALPAIGITAELIPVTFRQRMPMRGVIVRRDRPGRRRRAVGRHPAGVPRPAVDWVGSIDDLADDLLPYAIFTLLPLLGVLIVMMMGLLAVRTFDGRATPSRTSAPRSSSPSSGSA